ncbi:MAG: type II toxin-antitoxin system RatA family toxin [Alphaproteobacteria bacterium]|nr:type II toxin-antitoxin system RatA family toxin [Alphaproteobacteria bacterium]
MPTHSESRIVPFSARQLFDLVMDIEKYPQFLPWCIGARINSKSKNDLNADVIIGYKVFREVFSSRVHFTSPKEIEVEYLKGPMRHLHNKWVFRDLKEGQCKVDFYVDFSLKTKMFESLVDQFFHIALVRMINAFELRAIEVYGAKKN